MKFFAKSFLSSIAISLTLAMASVAVAAPGGDRGRPDNPGGGGGQGKPPENPGGGGGKPDNPGRGKGDAFAEQVILWRSEDGLPYYVAVPAGSEEGEGEAAASLPVPCLQPIYIPADPLGLTDEVDAYASQVTPITLDPDVVMDNPLLNLADGREASPVPLGGTGVAGEECDTATTPLTLTDYSTCDPDEDGDLDNICAEEVDFGRLSVARSPQRVIDAQLSEVIRAVQTAESLTLDHAGRLLYDGVTVDSPVQNLAIHQELMIELGLTSQTQDEIVLPSPYPGYSFLDHAASALGGAAEKGGGIDVDLVVYNNRVLNIPDRTLWPTLTGDIEAGVGKDGEEYFDFSTYSYDRDEKYPGCVTGYFLIDGTPIPFRGTISYWVFDEEPFEGENVHGFATAADDSMRVITFAHDNIVIQIDPVGENSENCSIPCGPAPLPSCPNNVQ